MIQGQAQILVILMKKEILRIKCLLFDITISHVSYFAYVVQLSLQAALPLELSDQKHI